MDAILKEFIMIVEFLGGTQADTVPMEFEFLVFNATFSNISAI